ncbi:MAG: hypothetical protein ABSG43_22435, partial [Solirubrobacteraceae bacterium]
LDDAIREHLDLKRRRGADPAEVERAEREALGPVRRNREPGAGSETDPVGVVGQAYDHEDDAVWAGEAEPEAWADEAEASSAFPRSGRQPDEEDWAHDAFEEHPDSAPRPASVRPELDDNTDRVLPDPESAGGRGAGRFRRGPKPISADSPIEGEETAEYRLDQAAAPAQPDEDMLEETPEFLQDTPDHDRLWFEQRPPRDFDFDS